MTRYWCPDCLDMRTATAVTVTETDHLSVTLTCGHVREYPSVQSAIMARLARPFEHVTF